MSLSKIIIYGTDEEVQQAVDQGVPINEIDSYGYTPLVQTAIVDSASKAKILLNAKADVDFSDLTGRTALHWVASNNNLEFCQLLLRHGANANAYTRAGQSALVIPYLRDYDKVKNTLYQHKASLEFAQDFVNAKILGHTYELTGRGDIVDHEGTFTEVEFEGFYLEFSLGLLVKSLKDFKRNFGGKHLKSHFNKLQHIIDSIENANALMRFQHYLIDKQQNATDIDKLLHHSTLVIPVAFEGHAITLIKHQDWLIRCDRGEFGREHGTIILYRVGRREMFTRSFIKELLYKRQDENFINKGIVTMLQLQPIGTLPLSIQISGNCSWSNVEAVLPALMYALLLEEKSAESVVNLKDCENEALHFYNEWLEWERRRSLEFCIQSFNSATPARKAAKATILAAILFQHCQSDDPSDQAKASKILTAISQKEFLYILKSYIKVFSKDRTNKSFKNLKRLIDDFGIDVDTLV